MSRVLKKSSEVDCTARTLHEESLHEAVVAAINQVLTMDDMFFENYRKSLDAALGANSELSLREIEEKLTEKQRVLISLSPEDPRYETVADDIYELRNRKQQVLMDDANRETAVRRAEELMEFVRAQDDEIDNYDDSLVRKLVEKVTVYDDRINTAFKSGVDVDIEA